MAIGLWRLAFNRSQQQRCAISQKPSANKKRTADTFVNSRPMSVSDERDSLSFRFRLQGPGWGSFPEWSLPVQPVSVVPKNHPLEERPHHEA